MIKTKIIKQKTKECTVMALLKPPTSLAAEQKDLSTQKSQKDKKFGAMSETTQCHNTSAVCNLSPRTPFNNN